MAMRPSIGYEIHDLGMNGNIGGVNEASSEIRRADKDIRDNMNRYSREMQPLVDEYGNTVNNINAHDLTNNNFNQRQSNIAAGVNQLGGSDYAAHIANLRGGDWWDDAMRHGQGQAGFEKNLADDWFNIQSAPIDTGMQAQLDYDAGELSGWKGYDAARWSSQELPGGIF